MFSRLLHDDLDAEDLVSCPNFLPKAHLFWTRRRVLLAWLTRVVVRCSTQSMVSLIFGLRWTPTASSQLAIRTSQWVYCTAYTVPLSLFACLQQLCRELVLVVLFLGNLRISSWISDKTITMSVYVHRHHHWGCHRRDPLLRRIPSISSGSHEGQSGPDSLHPRCFLQGLDEVIGFIYVMISKSFFLYASPQVIWLCRSGLVYLRPLLLQPSSPWVPTACPSFVVSSHRFTAG